MKGLQKIWDNLWKSRRSKELSGICLYTPFFYNHLKNPSSSVIDVGCGNLWYLYAVNDILLKEFLISEYPTNAFKYYVGVDISREALKLAKSSTHQYGIEHKTDFVQADLRFLPFRNNSFESVLCIETLQLLGEGYKEGLKEITRISDSEIYLSITKLLNRRNILKQVNGGWIIRSEHYPYPVLASNELEFKNILRKYGKIHGNEVHPCSLFSKECFVNKLLFKIKKTKM